MDKIKYMMESAILVLQKQTNKRKTLMFFVLFCFSIYTVKCMMTNVRLNPVNKNVYINNINNIYYDDNIAWI